MSLMGRQISPECILANITMLPLVFDQEMVIGLYWTLEAELFFYFIGWLLFVFGKLHHPGTLFSISLFFLLMFVVYRLLHFSNMQHIGLTLLPFHLSIMFWGCLVRMYYDDPQLEIDIFRTRIFIKFLVEVLTAAILFFPVISLGKGILCNEFEYTQNGLSYIIGIISFLLLSTTIKIQNKFIVCLGTISYSIYLFHPVVLYSLLWWLKHSAPEYLRNLHLFTYLMANFIFSIGFSSMV